VGRFDARGRAGGAKVYSIGLSGTQPIDIPAHASVTLTAKSIQIHGQRGLSKADHETNLKGRDLSVSCNATAISMPRLTRFRLKSIASNLRFELD
jgi:hypothetical protein